MSSSEKERGGCVESLWGGKKKRHREGGAANRLLRIVYCDGEATRGKLPASLALSAEKPRPRQQMLTGS